MKHLISGILKVTATIVLIATISACGGKEERKATYLEKGKAYMEEKNYDKARIEFKNVLQIDPKFAEAYFYMGQLEEKNKELGKALGNYKKAIELDPQYIAAKVQLAKIYVIAGTQDFIDKAKKLITESLSKEPNNSEAKLILATIEYKIGSKKKATKNLERIIKLDKNLVEGISLLSVLYLAEGKEAKAIALLKKGVEDNSNNIPLRVSLAKILVKNNDFTGAERYLQQAIDIEPDRYLLKVALASFYATSQQVDKALTLLREAIRQDDDDVSRYLVLVELLASRVSVNDAVDELEAAIKNKPNLYELQFAQVKFYEKIGKREEAKEVLKAIIVDKSYDVEGVKARNQLALYLLQEGDQHGARKYVDEVIAEYPNNNDALLVTSKLALANLEAITAINGLRTVVKNDPKNAEASLLLAQAHELNNESSLAENELKKAIEANPINDQVHVNYAKYLGSKGRIDEAVDVVDKALAYFKNSYDLMDIKLKILASQGKEDEIIVLLDLMEQANSAKAEVNITKGKYYLSKRDVTKAIEQFENAYDKSRDKYEPLKLIITAYMANNQSEKAMQRLQKRLDIDAKDAIANLLTGQIYLSQRKLPEARERFIVASQTVKTWFPPYTSLATTYLVENNFDKALTVYVDAAKNLKNKVPAQMKIAAIHEQIKDFSAAMATYQEILAENPSNKLAANNFASLLLDYGTEADTAKALELAKSFEKLQQPALQDTLGWAYAKSNDNAKAIEILKPIVEKAPKVAVFRYHLGYALHKMGDNEAAKSHLEIASSSKQIFFGKENAKEILKSL